MDQIGFMKKLYDQPVVTISEHELEMLLEKGESLRQQDTGLNGVIRVVRLGDIVVIQEKDARGTLLARRMPTDEEADRFVEERLATYDRMWDGCGCKIDYYADK